MALKFILIKDETGYDISDVVQKVEWAGRKNSPTRTLKLTILDDPELGESNRTGIDVYEGHHLIFLEDGKELFRGIIMVQVRDQERNLEITAYDNGIYLSNNKGSFSYRKKTATAMARFLNHARACMPGMNSYQPTPPANMKKILMSFAMLGALLSVKEDAEYDEKEGLRLTPEQLRTVEDTLKAYDGLKAKASQTESDLQGAKDALATAEQSIADKDALIATLTAERDDYKAKYGNAPATVPGVNGADVVSDHDLTADPMYAELEKYM